MRPLAYIWISLCVVSAADGQTSQPADKGVGVAGPASFSPVAQEAGNAALFVGINDFTKDKNLAPLRFAVNDAIATAHLFAVELKLVQPKQTALALSGEPSGDEAKAQLAELKTAGVRVGSAAKADIFLELQQVIAAPSNAEDILILGLSSHGFEESGVPFVMPADGVRAFLSDTAINLTSVEQALAKSKAGKRLLILDACREKPLAGGRGGDAVMAKAFHDALAQSAGQAVLASCDVGQVSFENEQVGHGVFTHYLLKALRGGAATDDQGLIRIDNVIDYVAREVEAWSKGHGPQAQQPWFKGPQAARRIPLAMDSAKAAARAERQRKDRERLDARQAQLKQLFIDEKINGDQYNLGRKLLAEDAATLDAQDRERLEYFVEVVTGKVPANRLQKLLDSVETAEERAARLERERVAALAAATLGKLDAAFSRKDAAEAYRLFDEVKKLSPGHPSIAQWAKRLEKLEPPFIERDGELILNLGGGVKMELVLIPAGEFTMGSPEDEEGRDNDEGPQRRVTISRPFYMGKYEVTNGQYRRFKSDHDSGGYEGVSLNGDDQPVVRVSWEDAQAFCDWLSRRSGREVRLPSEAQWEYTARGGDGREFPWGSSWPPSGRAGNYADETAKGKSTDWAVIEGYRDGYAATAPVGSFSPNPFGVYDLGGNVWEWCVDWYHEDYDGAPRDGSAWTSGGEQKCRVLRGGSWGDGPVRSYLRSASRLRVSPGCRIDLFGFRVVVPSGTSP